jgi:hypothetical protein
MSAKKEQRHRIYESKISRTRVERVVLNALAGNTASPLDIRAFGDCVPSSSEKTLHHEQKRSAEKIFTSRR